ncbi:MAG TPA: long-chain fatty acid--CoA ligase [Vicinamibacterales bacterium]|nr:long-chain fatty acid--CoA ligase [Vicinamibacterales bacterium]
MSILQGLRRAVHINGRGIATIDGDRRQTWSDFATRVAKFAGALAAAGVKPGDRVAILSLNSVTYLEFFYAAPSAGALVVPLNTRLAPPEIVAILNDAGAVALIVDETFTPVLPAIVPHLTSVKTVLTPAMLESAIAAADALTVDDADAADVYGIFYTGGTTAASKGVMLTHGNIIANAMNVLADVPLSRNTVYLHAAPMFHLADCAITFSATLVAGTHTFVPKFDPVHVIDTIERHRVTNVVLVPSMISMVVNHPTVDQHDLSSLRGILYGGSPIAEAVLRRALACLPNCGFTQAYGMTELAPIVTFLTPSDHATDGPHVRRLRSGGRPAVTAEIRIVDDMDRDVPAGTVGQIVARGPMVMKGYWNQPRLTAEALRGGWMHTGDGGYMDEDGYVYVVDRIKDMIISGGENVYSAEVENAIFQHPAVAMCAVIGVPDEKWGERVHAVVSVKPGQMVSDADLIAHTRTLIAGYKCPRTVDVRTEPLPLSGAGKVLKTVLRAEMRV